MALFPSLSNILRLARRAIQPPSRLWIGQDEGLGVDVAILSDVFQTYSLELRGRLLLASGDVVQFVQPLFVSGATPTQQFFFQLSAGFLLGVTVDYEAQAIAVRRPVYVRVQVGRGNLDPAAAPFRAFQALTEGYVDGTAWVTWPGGRQRHMWEGPGLHNIVVGTDPAAGVECSDTISPAFTRLVSWFGVLVTSAAVANREVELILDDGGTPLVIHAGGGNVVHTASRTLFYTAAAGLPAGLLRSDVVGIPLPTHARFGPGLRVRTATLNLQAGDNWAAPNLTLERLVHLT